MPGGAATSPPFALGLAERAVMLVRQAPERIEDGAKDDGAHDHLLDRRGALLGVGDRLDLPRGHPVRRVGIWLEHLGPVIASESAERREGRRELRASGSVGPNLPAELVDHRVDLGTRRRVCGDLRFDPGHRGWHARTFDDPEQLVAVYAATLANEKSKPK